MTNPADLAPGDVARLPVATGVVRGVRRHDARGLTAVTVEVLLFDGDVCEVVTSKENAR